MISLSLSFTWRIQLGIEENTSTGAFLLFLTHCQSLHCRQDTKTHPHSFYMLMPDQYLKFVLHHCKHAIGSCCKVMSKFSHSLCSRDFSLILHLRLGPGDPFLLFLIYPPIQTKISYDTQADITIFWNRFSVVLIAIKFFH